MLTNLQMKKKMAVNSAHVEKNHSDFSFSFVYNISLNARFLEDAVTQPSQAWKWIAALRTSCVLLLLLLVRNFCFINLLF